ncbi:MAG: hypothetical protein HDR80_06230 [Bacteroides sp.]|nr:hypothetical protein [Bacteroides sp.]
MLKSQKIAVARIFSDIIKADRIIDAGEMECWRGCCVKYGIDRDARAAARDVTFAAALKAIAGPGASALMEGLLADCRSMTVSDGFCAHSEALLMMALRAVLDPAAGFRGEVISLPRADFSVDAATVLYIESEYNPGVNDAIRRDFRHIFKELKLAGFHFIYVPRIIDHYRHTDPALFREILSFLAPSLSEAGLDAAYRSLMGITTEGFCKDLLCNKCGLDELRDTPPSLLVKLGNSFVGETGYSNYLRLEVDAGIAATVRDFVDTFSAMLCGDTYVTGSGEERDTRFHFHGFYKQLLDIFLIRRNIRSTVLIDLRDDEISFPEIDEKAKGLHRRERALYTLLLCQGSLGLDLSAPGKGEPLDAYDRRMQRLQRRYAAIYGMLGGDCESAPDLTVPEIRRPIMSCLRGSLKKLTALYNPQDYNVTKNSDGSFGVYVEPELVFVRGWEAEDPVPLRESGIFRRWAAL